MKDGYSATTYLLYVDDTRKQLVVAGGANEVACQSDNPITVYIRYRNCKLLKQLF